MKRFLFFILAAGIMASCSSSTKDADITVMSFNIRTGDFPEYDGENAWPNRKQAVLEMIATLQPDIIGMQEVMIDQRIFLTDSLCGYLNYGLDRESGLVDGRGESASIFYRTDRFTLVSEGTIWLSETPDTVSIGWDAACIRTASYVLLKDKQFNDREVYVLDTHFDHVGKVARREEGKMLMKWIDERFGDGATMILTGDFNSTVEDEALVPLNEGMTYARTSVSPTDSAGTYHNWGKIPAEKRTVIDHIYFKGFNPLSYRVVSEEYGVPFVSDHFPILATADYAE